MFYIRYYLPTEHRNKPNQSFTAEDGVNITYYDVGTYNGKKIDLKVSLVSYEHTSAVHTPNNKGINVPAAVFFRANSMDFYTIGIEWAQFHFRYYEHGTSNEISISGTGTLYDLDYEQKITFDEGIKDDNPNITSNGCVTFTQNSSSFKLSFGFPESTWKTESATVSTFGISGNYEF